MYVADAGTGTIRKVVLASGAVTTLAGSAGQSGSTDGTGAAARFNLPYGVAADGAGNLYVADSGNSTLRKIVLATRAVTTLAGAAGMTGSSDGNGNAARFYGLSGLAMDGAATLYVADSNQTIRKVVVATGDVTTLAGRASMYGTVDGTGAAARFYGPTGAAVDGAGNLYIAEFASYTIRKVVLATGVVTTLAGSAGIPGSTDSTGAAARFGGPSGVAADGAGNLYIADTSSNTIRKVVAATGVVTTLAGSSGLSGSTDGNGTAARFNVPAGVAVDGAGNLYVADTGNKLIRQIVVATGAVTTLAGSVGLPGSTDGTGPAARFNGPAGVAVDGAGNLYIADTGNSTIRKLVVATGAVTTLAGTAGLYGSADGTGAVARFNMPAGVAVDGAGNLYVADTGNSTVRKIQLASGSVTTLAGIAGQRGVKLGLPAGLNQPRAVVPLSSGDVIVIDENSVLSAH